MLSLFRILGPARGAGAHSLFFLLNFVASAAVAHDDLVYPAFRVGLALPSAEPQAEPLRPPPPDIISMHEQQALNKPF